MIKRMLLGTFAFTLLTATAFAEVKEADLAGSWYPASNEKLENQLDSYLENASPPKIDGQVLALISPHAGYLYSGPVAAYGFKAIAGQDIETVIVVGFSHKRGYYDGIAILDSDGFKTPLGVAEIDKDLTRELIASHPKIYNYPIAFSQENSVETQIPFIQTTLEDSKVVLLSMGKQSLKNSKVLGEALYEVLKDKEKYLLLASTDMSHYMPYQDANTVDARTISIIKEFDVDKLYKENLSKEHGLMCGSGPVCAVMIASKMLGADKIEILKYANSGDVVGDKSHVVGYLSAAITKISENLSGGDMLTDAQKKRLLQIARESMEIYVRTGKRLEITEEDALLNKPLGAFVTLHRGGRLRGCIGNIIGRQPLYLTVRDMAVEAAVSDPRFPPVSVAELSDIDLEVSALSELEKIDDPNVIEMGKHGVLIRSGGRSGGYLPQVATETGWSREEFMDSLCSQKAGLPQDAWKTGACEIYIFTAEVFKEK